MSTSLLLYLAFIVFVTYERVKKARVFGPGKTFQPSVLQHSNSLGPWVCYEDKEVL